MSSLLQALQSTVQRFPGRVVAAVLLLSAIFAGLSTQAVIADNDISLSSGSEASLTQDRIGELFGNGQETLAVQVIVTSPDVLSPSGLAVAADLSAAIQANPAIAPMVLQGPEGRLAVTTWADLVLGSAAQQGLDPSQLDDAEIEALQLAALATLPPEQAAGISGLLAADQGAGIVIVMLDPTADADALVDAQLAFGDLGVDVPTETSIHPFNMELLNAESQDAVETQMGKLLGLAMLLIIVILILINRNVVDVVSSVVGLVLAIVWMNGIGTLLGPGFLEITSGMGEMTMAIPILLVGLGVDYGIHLASRFREERAAGADSATAAAGSIGAVGAALTLATLTTVVGFLTNLANPLTPLQDFGVLAAVGVVAAFAIMTSFVPAMRLLADNLWSRRHDGAQRPAQVSHEDGPGLLGNLASHLAPIAAGRPWAVLGVAAVVTIAAGLSATGLTTTFSQTEFFPEGSDALATIELLEESFGGDLAETTSVLVEGDVAANTDAIDAFVAALADNEDVRTVDGRVQADVQFAPDGTAALVTISTTAGESLDRLETDVRADAAALETAGLDVRLTSSNLLITAVMDDLRDSQVSGLVLTLVASMVILALAFWVRRRAPMLGVLAIASVAIVTVWVLGVMALAGIPFNMMTAMISALAIGIGVPFGIHVVNRFLEELTGTHNAEAAIVATLRQTGGALVGSAVTTMAGFGVLALSTIRPMQQFGIVTAMTIGFALVSSVVVLPAMLALWARRQPETATPLEAAADQREPVSVG